MRDLRLPVGLLDGVFALAEDDGIFDELVKPDWPAVRTAIGGDSRARTVLNGVVCILENEPGAEWVLVHDAARPCLSRAELERLVGEGLGCEDGAILAFPVSDTLKWAGEDGRIDRTIDRSHCWAAQTPQLFPIRTLAEQLQNSLNAEEAPTDDPQDPRQEPS